MAPADPKSSVLSETVIKYMLNVVMATIVAWSAVQMPILLLQLLLVVAAIQRMIQRKHIEVPMNCLHWDSVLLFRLGGGPLLFLPYAAKEIVVCGRCLKSHLSYYQVSTDYSRSQFPHYS